ncbi:MAG: hypothetical protein JO301_13240 [Chitinophagaceae bacterium]|nr:hypothetical protein [Chitinophagaceae bacterium]
MKWFIPFLCVVFVLGNQINMSQFIIHNLHSLSEIAALLASVYYYRTLKGSFMRWFCPFLFLISALEIFPLLSTKAAFFTNYATAILQAFFYCYLFCQLSGRKRSNFIFSCLTAVIISVFFAALFLEKDRNHLFYLSKIFVALGALMTAMYLYYLYKKIDEDHFYLTSYGFWIAFGVIIFFSGISFIFSLYTITVTNQLNFLGERLYRIVPRILCVILYSSIIVSFVLYKRSIEHQTLQPA